MEGLHAHLFSRPFNHCIFCWNYDGGVDGDDSNEKIVVWKCSVSIFPPPLDYLEIELSYHAEYANIVPGWDREYEG